MAGRKAFPLRLSADLYEDLRRWADAELRSVNGQIEYLLRQAVDARRKAGPRAVPGRAGPGPAKPKNDEPT
jgi:hypothetical protein